MKRCTSRIGHLFNRTGIKQGEFWVRTAEHHKALHKAHIRHVHYSTCVFCGATKTKVEFGD